MQAQSSFSTSIITARLKVKVVYSTVVYSTVPHFVFVELCCYHNE